MGERGDEYQIRPYDPETDEAFIFRAWLEGHWPGYAGAAVTPKSTYLVEWHRLIERILSAPDTTTVVATVVDTLVGFACASPDFCLHWCYVKQPFRGQQIGYALISDLGLGGSGAEPRLCSHWSPHLHPAGWSYDPRILRRYQP